MIFLDVMPKTKEIFKKILKNLNWTSSKLHTFVLQKTL